MTWIDNIFMPLGSTILWGLELVALLGIAGGLLIACGYLLRGMCRLAYYGIREFPRQATLATVFTVSMTASCGFLWCINAGQPEAMRSPGWEVALVAFTFALCLSGCVHIWYRYERTLFKVLLSVGTWALGAALVPAIICMRDQGVAEQREADQWRAANPILANAGDALGGALLIFLFVIVIFVYVNFHFFRFWSSASEQLKTRPEDLY
jgi:hypothetical protein